ncbi:MAG: type I-E CRISPR-associated protein Cse2/CasB [Methanoregula sp.]|jgi:CRISPR system Cascade subunit CasB
MGQKTDLTFSHSGAREALLSWWKELDNVRGDRAALRQCHNPLEVAFTPAFHRLKIRLEAFGSISPDQMNKLAIVAGVLSHVKENKPYGHERNLQRAFAIQMASSPSNGGPRKKACVSSLRFRQLLKIENQDELYTTMIRLVRLIGGSVDIASLANGIYWWNELMKKEWAYAYYENAPSEEKQGV